MKNRTKASCFTPVSTWKGECVKIICCAGSPGDFIYNEVKDTYGQRGNVSVPPPVILKMMLLLILYNVRSERELMETIPERLDWLWFLGYDLDDEIPNDSVPSEARARWGVKAFRSFFEQIVWQCIETGLVDGGKLFAAAPIGDQEILTRREQIKKKTMLLRRKQNCSLRVA